MLTLNRHWNSEKWIEWKRCMRWCLWGTCFIQDSLWETWKQSLQGLTRKWNSKWKWAHLFVMPSVSMAVTYTSDKPHCKTNCGNRHLKTYTHVLLNSLSALTVKVKVWVYCLESCRNLSPDFTIITFADHWKRPHSYKLSFFDYGSHMDARSVWLQCPLSFP